MATAQVPTMQELLEAGVHFGHKVSRGHPKMGPYIYGAREGVHIIDLAKSEEHLKTAIEFVHTLGTQKKTLLVVATKKQAQELVMELSKEAGAYYMTDRWVGGLLTNMEEMRRNINKLLALKKEQDAGTLSRYTKKEQLLIRRKLEKFDREFGGVSEMTKLPDAVFIVDAVTEDVAIREATRMNLPLVGFADTNSNPVVFDYPIPANDDGIKSIKIVSEAILQAYGAGRKGAKAADEAAAAAEQKKQEDDAAAAVNGKLAEEAAALEEEVEKAVVDEAKI